jgi:hypothetical protein
MLILVSCTFYFSGSLSEILVVLLLSERVGFEKNLAVWKMGSNCSFATRKARLFRSFRVELFLTGTDLNSASFLWNFDSFLDLWAGTVWN